MIQSRSILFSYFHSKNCTVWNKCPNSFFFCPSAAKSTMDFDWNLKNWIQCFFVFFLIKHNDISSDLVTHTILNEAVCSEAEEYVVWMEFTGWDMIHSNKNLYDCFLASRESLNLIHKMIGMCVMNVEEGRSVLFYCI